MEDTEIGSRLARYGDVASASKSALRDLLEVFDTDPENPPLSRLRRIDCALRRETGASWTDLLDGDDALVLGEALFPGDAAAASSFFEEIAGGP